MPFLAHTPIHRTALPAVLLLALTGGCAGLREAVIYPDASIRGVRVAGVTLSGLELEFDVEIENPYGSDLPMIGLDYVLSSRGRQFLKGAIEVDETIPAKETRIVPLSVILPFLEVREVAKTLSPGEELPYAADLGVKVRAPVVGSIRLPISTEGTLDLPSLP